MHSFIETKLFSRLVVQYLTDEEYGNLQQALIKDPDAGDLISGSGGVRKLRWGVARRGKRGGIRVIYYARVSPGSNMDANALREERDGKHLSQLTSQN
ncbi:MAG: type II toxin-antitoxin system RelE/ParE family toxin [Pyrinomonadaceae bacterium]